MFINQRESQKPKSVEEKIETLERESQKPKTVEENIETLESADMIQNFEFEQRGSFNELNTPEIADIIHNSEIENEETFDENQRMEPCDESQSQKHLSVSHLDPFEDNEFSSELGDEEFYFSMEKIFFFIRFLFDTLI